MPGGHSFTQPDLMPKYNERGRRSTSTATDPSLTQKTSVGKPKRPITVYDAVAGT